MHVLKKARDRAHPNEMKWVARMVLRAMKIAVGKEPVLGCLDSNASGAAYMH